MNRVLRNCKKVVAATALCMIVTCGLFSVSQAGTKIDAGRKYSAKNGYQSITEVSAYESNGVAKKLRVGAYIGNSTNEDTGLGYVKVKTGWVKKIADAKHGYVTGFGEIRETDKFVNNKAM